MSSTRHSPLQLSLILLLVFNISIVASADPVEWAVPVDGNWSVPSNWNPAMVPGATSDVIIAASGTFKVTLDVDANVSSLTLGGAAGTQTLMVSDRIVTSQGEVLVKSSGRLELQRSTTGGTGSVTNQGTILADQLNIIDIDIANEGFMRFRGAGNEITGAFSNTNGGRVRIEGDKRTQDAGFGEGALEVAKGFTNEGTIELRFQIRLGGKLAVADGVLLNRGLIQTRDGDGHTLNAQFDNQGEIRLEGDLRTERDAAHSTNEGTIALATGSWTFTQIDSGTPYQVFNYGTIDIGGGEKFGIEKNGVLILGATGDLTTSTGTLSLLDSAFELRKDLMAGMLRIEMLRSRIFGSGKLYQQGTLLADHQNILDASTTNESFMRFRGAGNEITGAFSNTSSGLLRIEGDKLTQDGGLGEGTLEVAKGFTNDGTIELRFQIRFGGKLTITDGLLLNQGLIRTRDGDGHSLNAQIDNRGEISLGGDLRTESDAGHSTNEGTIALSNGSWTFSQIDSSTPHQVFNYGTIEIAGGEKLGVEKNGILVLGATGHLTTSTGTLSLLDSDFELRKDLMAGALRIEMSRSRIFGSGKFHQQGTLLADFRNILDASTTNEGFMRFRGAGNEITAAFSNTSSGFLRIEGDKLTQDGGLGEGTLEVAKGFTNDGTIELRFQIRWGGKLTITDGVLLNEGLIRTQDGGDHRISGPVHNSGEVVVTSTLRHDARGESGANSGVISFATTGTLILEDTFFNHTGVIEGGGILEITNSAVFSASGPIQAKVENNGELNIGASPARVAIDGDFEQSNQGMLNIELGGTNPGSEHDQLQITGIANLGGILDVARLNDFIPGQGDRFVVLTYNSNQNQFSTVNGLSTGDGIILLTHYGDTSLSLEAENPLNHPQAIDFYERWRVDQTDSSELIRRSRTWYAD